MATACLAGRQTLSSSQQLTNACQNQMCGMRRHTVSLDMRLRAQTIPGSSSEEIRCRSSGPAAAEPALAGAPAPDCALSSMRASHSASCGLRISLAHTPTASRWLPPGIGT